jgi:hypothetical protein
MAAAMMSSLLLFVGLWSSKLTLGSTEEDGRVT